MTFSVDDPDSPGGRLQAVSNLATALDADFQKVYVVSKADAGAAIPPVPLDSNGPVVFRSTHVPVRQAIQTVAAVDSATTQISGAVTGSITFPSASLSASAAAAFIAKQTGTEWKAYYGLFKRGEAPSRLNGVVLDRTADGQPITVQPLLSYRSSAPVTVPLHTGQDAVVGPFSPLSTAPNVATVGDANFGFADGFGFGDPYGYANSFSPYGYAGPDGSFATPGAVYTPGVGVSPAVPGVNAPPANAAAGTNGQAILPGFPYTGSVGKTPSAATESETVMTELLAASLIRDVPDFPKSGILFKDITPVLGHPEAFREVIKVLAEHAASLKPDLVAGIESRGFLLGAPVALALGVGFVPIRKAGKLPSQTEREEYTLEYGTAIVEIHRDAVQPGERVLIMDDLLATGGTAAAVVRLIEKLGGTVAGLSFLIELGFLPGRDVLNGYEVHSLLRY